jgi:hypothetical protein
MVKKLISDKIREKITGIAQKKQKEDKPKATVKKENGK